MEKEVMSSGELRQGIADLIDDEKFVAELEKYPSLIYGRKLAGLTKKEKIDIVCDEIGNEARTYILKYIVLKRKIEILLENKQKHLDEFWIDVLNKYYLSK